MTAIILLSVVGIAVLLAELVLPGGILGVIGILCLVAAVVLTYIEYGAVAGTIGVAVLFVFGICSLGWWMKFFHRLPVTRKMILESASGNEKAENPPPSLVGRTGITVTDLVPSGHALFDGEKIAVIAEAGVIKKNSPVRIIEERGPSLIVAVDETAAESGEAPEEED